MGSDKELWLHCRQCGRKWKAFDLPIDAMQISRMMRKQKCVCGNKNPAICKTAEQPA